MFTNVFSYNYRISAEDLLKVVQIGWTIRPKDACLGSPPVNKLPSVFTYHYDVNRSRKWCYNIKFKLTPLAYALCGCTYHKIKRDFKLHAKHIVVAYHTA